MSIIGNRVNKRQREPADENEHGDISGVSLRQLRTEYETLLHERDSLREQVIQLHRAKLAGDLLAGVGHDLTSALTGLLWCCEALQQRVKGSEDEPAGARNDTDLGFGLEDFMGGVRYARSLSERLMRLGRQQVSPQTNLPVQEVVERSLKLIEMLRPTDVAVMAELAAEGACVRGNETQLQQALLNLASNAFDAMRKGGGTLTLGLSRQQAEGGSPWLRLQVRDTGEGMAESVAARVFEPFFTTKGPAAGTGLGLAVVRNVVETHGGQIEVHSEPGAGTVVEIRLPEYIRGAR